MVSYLGNHTRYEYAIIFSLTSKNISNATQNYYELKTAENIGFLILLLIIILLVYGGFWLYVLLKKHLANHGLVN